MWWWVWFYRGLVDSGDVIMFVDDLDTLRDSMELEYKIEIVDGDEWKH